MGRPRNGASTRRRLAWRTIRSSCAVGIFSMFAMRETCERQTLVSGCPTRLARVVCVSGSGVSASNIHEEGVCSVRACVLMLLPQRWSRAELTH